MTLAHLVTNSNNKNIVLNSYVLIMVARGYKFEIKAKQLL